MAKRQAHHLAEERYGQYATGFDYAQSQSGYAPSYEYNYGGGAPYGAPGCPSYDYGRPPPPAGGYGGYGPPPGPPPEPPVPEEVPLGPVMA